MTKPIPIEVLETQASEQRRQIHNDLAQLRTQVRETMQPRKLARQYLVSAAGLAALVGLLFGYAIAGMFTRD